ncbi:hypothetical protein [Filimonas effusa]|uniref:Uncharacterized protein n=1 Tax=Filimonas effusa TaxID=2508721 RepID=A0A4Q1DB24_9BACT|nr:hypothetical protein [Filimonas effusa]RXK85975.1 hypothetical protein ESB13_03960 [Filimonas effusa]
MKPKEIIIMSLVDVVGALASDNIKGNLYLFDNNKSDGSLDEGTGVLKTKVKTGDVLIWTIMSMEPESYAAISNITIDPEVCSPVTEMYPDSDVSYWQATVLKEVTSVPYKITFEVGVKKQQVETRETPSLIG